MHYNVDLHFMSKFLSLIKDALYSLGFATRIEFEARSEDKE